MGLIRYKCNLAWRSDRSQKRGRDILIIKNALIYRENASFETGDIFIRKDRIGGYSNCSGEDLDEAVINADGLFAIPGLTDIHFHGCSGYDFCDGTKEAFDAITDYEASQGVTTLCPATMTLPEERLSDIMKSFDRYRNETGSILCGINLEGPFLSAKKKGAQKEEYLRKADISMFQRLQELSGNKIRIVDIAPEEEGALDFISAVKDSVVVSIAHTTADYETSMEAFKRGASHVTHLFNAMPAFLHRDPGVIGAAFDTQNCHVEMICDGIHLHPGTIRAAVRMFGRERIVFISDSIMAAGLKDGSYSLGGQEVQVTGKRVTLKKDDVLAGSATNLMDCMKYAVLQAGIPLETAVWAAAVNPARVIGIDSEFGSITPGKVANIVLLDKELNTKVVILKGKIIKADADITY